MQILSRRFIYWMGLVITFLFLSSPFIKQSLNNITNLSLLQSIMSHPNSYTAISSCIIVAPRMPQVTLAEAKKNQHFINIGQSGSENLQRNLGTLALVSGYLEQAKARFEHALTLQPNDEVVHLRLSQILAALAQPIEAANELKKTRYATAARLADFGWRLWNQNKLNDALICFKIGVAFDPLNALVRIGKGRMLSLIGQNGDALVELNKAIQFCPECAQGYLYRAFVRLALKQSNEEIENDFARALALDPTGFDTQYAWANWLYYLGRVADSEKYYQRIIESYPDILEPYLTLFRIYLAMNRPSDAAAILKSATHKFNTASELEKIFNKKK